MAALDLQEQEQVEALKAWWKDNQRWIIGGALTVALVLAGWRGWHYYQHKQASEASALYQQVVEQLASGDAKRVNDASAAVMDKYASSAYAARAALLAAQVNEQGKDIQHAKTQLQWVVDNASESSLKDVARLRLAALLLDEKNYPDALKYLDAKHPESFDGLYADLKGDVLSAQGNVDAARSAYKQAYEKTAAESPYRNLIQIKLDALGAAK